MFKYTLSKVALVVILVSFLFLAFHYTYGFAYQKGYNQSFYTMRVTNVEEQGNNYLVLIRDDNNELYVHSCSK